MATSNQYKIGVDGGGSKTELILIDAAGEIVARHTGPGCNPSQVGADQARKILQVGLETLLTQAKVDQSAIAATLLCMAGSQTFWAETAASLAGYGTVRATADSAPVLELATAGAPGIVLHAGTGSFVIFRTPGGTVRYTGGLGWKFGDPGSGYDLGQRGIAQALLDLQAQAGSEARPTQLAEALCVHTGLMDYAGNSRFFYSDDAARTTIASFAPIVLRLAGEECQAAQQAVASSVAALLDQADRVLRRHFAGATGKIPCGVSGKILNHERVANVLRIQAGHLVPAVELNFIATPPIEGVRRLLLAPA